MIEVILNFALHICLEFMTFLGFGALALTLDLKD